MNSAERETAIDRYMPAVEAIVERWAVGKPLNPFSNKANGYYRLTSYLLEYLIEHNAFPAGVHEMPEGRDRFNNIEPSFPVDFDVVVGDASLP
ncbi:MAG: hypothetical protein HGB00_07100 [Chlorobiaceae bacterium]|nr:hypothetical protein [Chlorobiaceae bacterium]